MSPTRVASRSEPIMDEIEGAAAADRAGAQPEQEFEPGTPPHTILECRLLHSTAVSGQRERFLAGELSIDDHDRQRREADSALLEVETWYAMLYSAQAPEASKGWPSPWAMTTGVR